VAEVPCRKKGDLESVAVHVGTFFDSHLKATCGDATLTIV
jgi:hypothetical protein